MTRPLTFRYLLRLHSVAEGMGVDVYPSWPGAPAHSLSRDDVGALAELDLLSGQEARGTTRTEAGHAAREQTT